MDFKNNNTYNSNPEDLGRVLCAKYRANDGYPKGETEEKKRLCDQLYIDTQNEVTALIALELQKPSKSKCL